MFFYVVEALLTLLCLSLTNAALLVHGMFPQIEFFADFLYTVIINLTGRQIYRDGRGGRRLLPVFATSTTLPYLGSQVDVAY